MAAEKECGKCRERDELHNLLFQHHHSNGAADTQCVQCKKKEEIKETLHNHPLHSASLCAQCFQRNYLIEVLYDHLPHPPQLPTPYNIAGSTSRSTTGKKRPATAATTTAAPVRKKPPAKNISSSSAIANTVPAAADVAELIKQNKALLKRLNQQQQDGEEGDGDDEDDEEGEDAGDGGKRPATVNDTDTELNNEDLYEVYGYGPSRSPTPQPSTSRATADSETYFGVVATVPGYDEPKIFAPSDDGSITYLEEAIRYLIEISKHIKQLFDERTRKYRTLIEDLIDYHQSKKDVVGEKIANGVLQRLCEYQRRCTLLFWNLSFDISVLRGSGFLALLYRMDGGLKLLKKSANQYIVIQSDHLQIKCAFNYLNRCNLAKYLRSMGMEATGEGKQLYPYSLLTNNSMSNLQMSLDKICVKDFHNVLSGENSLKELKSTNLEENLQELKNFWAQKGLVTFGQLTEFYLASDIVPLSKCMKKYNEIFFSAYKINLMSDYLTHTSAGLAIMVHRSNNKARLVAIDDEEIESDMAKSIVGGFSANFNRVNLVGVTPLHLHRHNRWEDAPICAGLLYLDIAGCYGKSLMQSLPTGWYTVRKRDEQWRRQVMGKKHHLAAAFCNWFSVHYHLWPNPCHLGNSLTGEKWIHIDGPPERRIRVDLYFRDRNRTIILEVMDDQSHWFCPIHHTDLNDAQKKLRKKTELRLLALQKQLPHAQIHVKNECCIRSEMEKPQTAVHQQMRDFIERFQVGNLESKHHYDSLDELLDDVQNDKLTGFLHCDIMMPKEVRDKWSDIIGPCFRRKTVSYTDLDPHQQRAYAGLKYTDQPTIVNAYSLTNHLLSTTLLKYYLSLGMKVTNADYFLEYELADMFKAEIEKLAIKKTKAQLKGNTIKAALFKLLINAIYGNHACLVENLLVPESTVAEIIDFGPLVDELLVELCGELEEEEEGAEGEEEENILTLLGGTGESDYEDDYDNDDNVVDDEAIEVAGDDDDAPPPRQRGPRRHRRIKGQKETAEQRFNRLVSSELFVECLPLDVPPPRPSDYDAANDPDPDRQLEDDDRHRIWEISSFKRSTIIKFSKAVSLFVLEYAKVQILRIWYDLFRPCINWQDIQPVFTDTDSLMLALAGDGTLESVVRPDQRALFAELAPQFLDAYAPAAQQVRYGLWSDSAPAGRRVTGCVALSPKVYCYLLDDGTHVARCKSVPLKDNDRLLTFENYLAMAADPYGELGRRGLQAQLRNIQTKHGQTCTVLQQRTCLRGFLRKSRFCEALLHAEDTQE